MARILRADLVVVDDIGLLPVGADAAEGLYRLVDAAYEKRSIAVSSNLHPAGFDELMPKTLATATVDRLLHHAHVSDQRRQRPPHPSPHRQRGEPLELTTRSPVATLGQFPWRPPPGNSHGRHWAGFMTVSGQKPMALDNCRCCSSRG